MGLEVKVDGDPMLPVLPREEGLYLFEYVSVDGRSYARRASKTILSPSYTRDDIENVVRWDVSQIPFTVTRVYVQILLWEQWRHMGLYIPDPDGGGKFI